MNFRYRLVSSQQKFVNDFIYFKLNISDIIKTKQLLLAFK